MSYKNIGIIGPVSSGKSTLINCLFEEYYCKTALKRTTLVTQIYTETEIKSISSKEIRIKNNIINDKLYSKKLNFGMGRL